VQFAARFVFWVTTQRHWERSDHSSHGTAQVLRNVIDRDPCVVLQALR
jgi:DNA-binding transcriptional regulator YiaG